MNNSGEDSNKNFGNRSYDLGLSFPQQNRLSYLYELRPVLESKPD